MTSNSWILLLLLLVVALLLWLNWRTTQRFHRLRNGVTEITGEAAQTGESSDQFIVRVLLQLQHREHTSRMQIQQQIREGALYAAAMDYMSVPVVVLSSEQKPLFANRAMYQWMEESVESILQRSPKFDLQDPLNTNLFAELVDFERLKPGERESISIGERTVQAILDPVTMTGGGSRYVLVWEDYTTQRSIERKMEDVIGDILYGYLGNMLDVDEFSGFMKFMGISINQIVETVRDPILELLRVLPLIEQGDLTESMGGNYAGKYQSLQESLNGMIDSLNEILLKVQTATVEIEQRANAITEGNRGLSERIGAQSDSSERITASVARMAEEFRMSSENADRTSALSTRLRADAEEGESIMQRAVEAMREITGSSQKISEIITLIDSIAFQTNLLALNAAVEAARAGEHGRGFAVVADEVRNLAQRSAASASEIKQLISDNVVRIDEGSQLVQQTGEVFTKIASDVSEVSRSVEEISTAGRQQLQSIEEMNRSLDQLSDSNRKNREMVEMVEHSSQEILSVSTRVVREMDSFSLDPERIGAGEREQPQEGAPKEILESIVNRSKEDDYDGLDVELF